MIQFIDKEGNLFSGDKPFTHWFDEPLSVGLKAPKTILFLSQKRLVNCSIENNDFIKIVKQDILGTATTQVEIHDVNYEDLNKILGLTTTSVGYQLSNVYNKLYLHAIYLVADGVSVCEAIINFIIDGVTYEVGVDIYDIEETHKINLSNNGIQIPDEFVKTIYDTNVREDFNNPIVVNRKLKELILEGVDIIHKKGSYKSLLNSMKWFEWGDSLVMREYWKDKDDNSYLYNELKEEFDSSMNSIISEYTKTTYIGLYGALNKLKVDKQDKIVYEHYQIPAMTMDGTIIKPITLTGGPHLFPNDIEYNREMTLGNTGDGRVQIGEYPSPEIPPAGYMGTNFYFSVPEGAYHMSEPVPEVMSIAHRWANYDLQLKMTLLGNFFSTYFMPIHMDLLHSTIENMIYTNCIKIYESGDINRVDYVDNLGSFACSLDTGNKYFYMKDEIVSVTNKTLLGVSSFDNHISYGVSTMDIDNNIMSEKDLKIFLMQYKGNPLSLVPISIDAHNKKIKRITISLSRWVIKDVKENTYGWEEVLPCKSFSTSSLNPLDEEGNNIIKSKFSFNILLDKLGTYNIGISLHDFSGNQYPRSFEIISIDESINDFKVCRLKRKLWNRNSQTFPTNREWYTTEDWPFATPIDPWNESSWMSRHFSQLMPNDMNPDSSYLTHVCVSKLECELVEDKLYIINMFSDDSTIFKNTDSRVYITRDGEETWTRALNKWIRAKNNRLLNGYVWEIRTKETTNADDDTTTIDYWMYGVKKTFGNNLTNVYISYGEIGTCKKSSNYISNQPDNNIYPYYNTFTFFPSLFSPVELSQDELLNVKLTDVLQLVPNIKFMKNCKDYISPNTNTEIPLWRIECASDTRETSSSKRVGYNYHTISPIIYLNNNPKSKGQRIGYYNISLNYMLDSTPIENTFDSAFLISK